MHKKIIKAKFKNFLAFTLGIIVSISIILFGSSNISALGEFTSEIALISAGISYPEGGYSLISKTDLDRQNSIDSITPVDISKSSQNQNNLETKKTATITHPTDQAEPENQASEQTLGKGTAKLIRTQYGGKLLAPLHIALKNNSYVKNKTKHSYDEVVAMSKAPMAFNLKKSKEIQVLIMHTHATECYQDKISNFYSLANKTRTTDNNKNMTAVGKMIVAELNNAGIGAIQDTTQHDYPSYNGSYNRSAKTVSSYLKKYPSIKIVIDLHRDAITTNDLTVIAPAAKINGKSAAQVMIIAGCDNGKYNMPNYPKNLAFACRLQEQMEFAYKGLTRPILFDYRKYNQNLTTGSILIEVGSQGNSLDEAKYTGELIGKSLSKLAT